MFVNKLLCSHSYTKSDANRISVGNGVIVDVTVTVVPITTVSSGVSKQMYTLIVYIVLNLILLRLLSTFHIHLF